MENPTIASHNDRKQDTEIWIGLRQAISKSSGFQSWQQERNVSEGVNLEQQVKRYLKETLETLAY